MIECFILKCKQKKLQKEYSRKLLEYSIKSYFNMEIKDLSILKNKYGKPFFANKSCIKFNISHCDGLIACAVGVTEIGVDVENIRAFDNYVAYRVCNEEEIDDIYNSSNSHKTFFTYWTMKESLGKALGVGLNYPLKKNIFIKYKDEYLCSYKGFFIKNYEIDNKFILSICMDKGEEIILKEVKFDGREFYTI